MLKCDGVRAGYGSVDVLHDVSLQVAAGETVALLGANGAGKSTLLRSISGVVRPRAGQITVNGSRVERRAPHRIVDHGVAHCPEGRQLFAGLTVRDNLLLGAVAADARARARETLREVMDLFPVLRERAQQDAGLLSGGEGQMCAIGRALMNRPRLLLLDEPSLGLAPAVQDRVFDAIGRLGDTGIAILLVEQNVRRSLAIASRGYVLQRGRIVLTGTAEELRQNSVIPGAYLGESRV